MRIHLIIDPNHKVTPELPEDMALRNNIRFSHIELEDGFTADFYREKTAELLDIITDTPRD